MSGLVRYRSFIADTARWDGFTLRDDDIVITTPSKSGTTWVQTIVALLLFDGVPDQAIDDLSPWLDMHTRSRADTESLLAAQEHRRFIKTHAPLDGLPWSDDVTYVTVGRDPRDAFVSMLSHQANMDTDVVRRRRIESVGDEDLADLVDPWPDNPDPRVQVAAFIDLDRNHDHGDVNLANIVDHLAQAWQSRRCTNSVLVHYADLKADLPGEMRRLRDVLGLTHTDGRIEELAGLASLDSMRARAGRTAPAGADIWKDPVRFFRGGRRGDGAAMMTEEERRRYEDRCAELVDDDDLLAWVHGGRTAADPDRL